MEKPGLSSNEQLALASLVGIIILGGVVTSAVPFGGPLLALSGVFLLLTWWRHVGGYIGALGLGIAVLLGSVLGLVASLLVNRVDDVPAEIVFIGLSVVLIRSSRGAWRERRGADSD